MANKLSTCHTTNEKRLMLQSLLFAMEDVRKKLSMARAKIVRVRESLTRDKAQSLSSNARPWKT